MLTDEQIKAIAKEVIPAWAEWTHSVLAFAHAIEAAHSAGAQEPFPYQKTFDAIAAATSVSAGGVSISVIKFREAFGNTQPLPQTDASRHLSNLLARIHRDGGHYEAQHGIDKAVADADDKVAQLNAMTDTPTDEQQRQNVVWTATADGSACRTAFEHGRSFGMGVEFNPTTEHYHRDNGIGHFDAYHDGEWRAWCKAWQAARAAQPQPMPDTARDALVAIRRKLAALPHRQTEIGHAEYKRAYLQEDVLDCVDAEIEHCEAEDKLDALTDAARDVMAERQRQVSVEGWTPEHDDAHRHGTLARAAACYAAHAAAGAALNDQGSAAYRNIKGHYVSVPWPWDGKWWKPTAPRRDLVKAAALILAEIERLDRAKGE